jgi:hypothetical protein
MIRLKPITDVALVGRLRTKVAKIVDGAFALNHSELMHRRWFAVPEDKGRHVEPEAAPRLARAMADNGAPPFFALATEPTGTEPAAFLVEATVASLSAFSDECAGVNFLITSGEVGFALLFTSEDYNMYLGPRPFVAKALGTSIAEGMQRFLAYADCPTWEGRLMEVYRSCAAINANATQDH